MGNTIVNKTPDQKITSFGWAIKTVLEDKANSNILEGFLTALFGRPITVLARLESEGNQTDEADKYHYVGLLAQIEDGKCIIVEMLHFSEIAGLRQLVYGATRTIVEDLKLPPDTNVEKVYSICPLYFDFGLEGNDYVYHGKTIFTGFHTHRPVEIKRGLAGDEVRINGTYVVREYYLILPKRFPDIVLDNLDEWVYAFKNNEVPDEFTEPGIRMLREKLACLKMDEEER
uniref:PD-(D/E)XK nuclease family transposase n=1 Tax=Candidatus Kentrum sp. MB TaxID=2138164 RepID=A0A450XPX4_9GAMM|nr:MAG: PD-(D/E)XK nuclease family transposase [Candidatus Kentron sp. MB]VFK75432.1 MAG: PD-(D/E)XK nuclease family transposase [Candidatus Kentron sp. MB]